MMRETAILLASIFAGVLGNDGSLGCSEGASCSLPGAKGANLLQKVQKTERLASTEDESTEDESLEVGGQPWKKNKKGKGGKKKNKEPAWVTNVPEGLNKVENWDKDDCQRKCMMDYDKMETAGKGYCDYCGVGNACCKWNDPLTPTECSGVDEEPYMDKWGFVAQLTMKCVYPKASNISNYQKYKDEAWEAAMKLLTGSGTPTQMSHFAAPEVTLDGYKSIEGKGLPSYYLSIAVENNESLKEVCPALEDPTYGLSNKGLFDGMTYYSYPYSTASGSELLIREYCGAKYTDDPSEETQTAAAEMAKKACNEMGEKCGGYSVGADPECCGNTGCTDVVFLTGAAKAALTDEDDVIDKRPPSFKTGDYACNFKTYVKQ